jgi:TonB family protein
LQTRRPQISDDTEADPRVDLTAAQRLGIRSILVVPVFRRNDEEDAQHDPGDPQKDFVNHQTAADNGNESDAGSELMGIIEVFSASPHAFSDSHQELLQGFATECARIRVVATELGWHKPVASVSDDFMPPPLPQPDFGTADFSLPWPHDPEAPASEERPSPAAESEPVTGDVVAGDVVVPDPDAAIADQQHLVSVVSAGALPRSYEGWSLVLAALVIVAAIGISFLIGSRIGWFRQASQAATFHPALASPAGSSVSGPSEPARSSSEKKSVKKSASEATRPMDKTRARGGEKAKEKSAPDAGELVVYEKGKVVFRMKPPPATTASAAEAAQGRHQGSALASDVAGKDKNAVVEASSTARIAPSQNVWLSPQEAERRLLSHTEPKLPADVSAPHGAGNVVVEILVAEDGTVSNVQSVSGDPVLTKVAADAVRKWRYQPYRVHNLPAQFQTDVTVSFTSPN